MKHFFYVLFGGLGAIFFGIMIAYVTKVAWQISVPYLMKVKASSLSVSLPGFSSPSVASVAVSRPKEGTFISSLKRTIRYTANEEEDLMNAATLSLTSGSVKEVTANAYTVINLTDDVVAVTHEADKLLPIASLTKLVTAAVAKDVIDPEERVMITKSIMNTYGNTAFFKIGETFRAADLMYPLLMVSSNDAAEALAQDYGRDKFIKKMNEFVQKIGAYRTSFADPSGLSEKNVSTANDIVLILNWLRKNNPDIIAMTALKSKTLRSHTWTNPTHFLSWSNYLGGKNGYTDEANRTGAALFTMGKAKDVYAVVILGSSARDSDVVKLLGKVKE
jgi:D-alanyl-D-alanine carboxypeptidase